MATFVPPPFEASVPPDLALLPTLTEEVALDSKFSALIAEATEGEVQAFENSQLLDSAAAAEEVVQEAAHEVAQEVVQEPVHEAVQEAAAAAPVQPAQVIQAKPPHPLHDPVRLQAFIAHTVDEALALALQQALPRFLAQVRTQMSATVQRRLRDELEKGNKL
jgi:hypothetical protein